MAPLSGLEASPLAPLWSRLGRIVYRRGEAFYNSQGLMADVSALVAGGYTRIFR